jgi:hypothetical protein
MKKSMGSRLLAIFTLLIMAVVPLMTTTLNATALQNQAVMPLQNDTLQSNRLAMEYSILTSTMGTPVGMQGFEGEYAITSPYQMVEIVVQFVTPPAVALRLLQERSFSLGRTLPGQPNNN